MNDNDFEKWYKNYKQSGAVIIAFKEKNGEKSNMYFKGNTLEILYIFEEITKKLSEKIPKDVLNKCYEMAFDKESIGEENE